MRGERREERKERREKRGETAEGRTVEIKKHIYYRKRQKRSPTFALKFVSDEFLMKRKKICILFAKCEIISTVRAVPVKTAKESK